LEVRCPYCGEWIEIEIDEGGGAHQQYIEDCQVCCRPMVVTVDGDRVRVARGDA
jgi:hypothetical protein